MDLSVMKELGILKGSEETNLIKEEKSKVGLFLTAAFGGTAVLLSVICIPFVVPGFRRVCLPYVPASTCQVENVLEALKGRKGNLVDLGSGDGRIVFSAAKNGFPSTGVELNPWLVWYSRLFSYCKGLKNQTRFHKTDLFKFNTNPYNHVVIFGVDSMMAEVEQKLLKELKDNAYIIVCRFPLPTLKPIKIIGSGIDTVWVYKC